MKAHSTNNERVKNFVHRIIFRFWHEPWLGVFLILLLTVEGISIPKWATNYQGTLLHYLIGTLPLVFVCSLLPTFFEKRVVRRIISAFIALLFSLLFIYQFHLIKCGGGLISPTIILQYNNGNAAEIQTQFMVRGITLNNVLLSLAYILGCMLITFIVISLIHKKHGIIHIISYCTPILAFIIFSFNVQRNLYSKIPSYLSEKYFFLSTNERFYSLSKDIIKQKDDKERIAKKFQEFKIAINEQPIRPPHNVVLIIGESLRPLDMHCYGYPLQNTPHIDSLIATKQLIPYTHVASAFFNTNKAIALMLTYITREQELKGQEWYDYPTLPLFFNKAGYYTYWCSNQEPSSVWVSYIESIYNTCQEKYFVLTDNNLKRLETDPDGNYDEYLFPQLKHTPIDGKNLFEIVHLQGNHSIYTERYPKKWNVYNANDINESRLKPQDRQITAEYMNSILYNDWIVSEVIKHYSNSSSIIIYLSDHGISRFDDPNKPNHFHHNPHYTGLRIPFFVYMSRQFEKENPDVAQKVRNLNPNTPFVSDGLSHSLIDLLGIKTNWDDPKHALWNKAYNEPLPRKIPINGKIIIMPEDTLRNNTLSLQKH